MSFHHYRTSGIVLKKSNRGEANQILTVYTQDFGKLEILGKAIRKIKSKLRSGADLFYFSEFEFIQGKAHKTLTGANLIEKFSGFGQNLENLASAYKIADALDVLLPREEKDEKVWELLKDVLSKLNNSPASENYCSLSYYYFLWHLLSMLGYRADLYNCASCQSKLENGRLFFNPEIGGVICPSCHKADGSFHEISPDIVKILRLFINHDWPTLAKLRVEDVHKKSLKAVSENYLNYHRPEAGRV